MYVKQLHLKMPMHLKLQRLPFFMSVLMVFLSISAFAQTAGNYQISGTVTDANGEPLIGVVVSVKDLQAGTTTDLNGNYALALSKEAKVTFSFLGYKAQTITVGKGGVFNVKMEEDVAALNEVVVIGYGTTTKKDMTGAVTSLKAADVIKGPAVSSADMLVGKAAGLFIVPSDGNPGSGTTIRIRGESSLSATNTPMIVIDGVPIYPDANVGQPNMLSSINPDDIASFTVLKDASSTAIYGSRASNGVIIITTKKGSDTKGIKVGYNSSYSVTVNTSQVAMLSPQEFRSYIDQYYPAGTLNGDFAHKLLDYTYPDGTKGVFNTNWQDQIYQAALNTDQNVNVTGGGKFPFRVSLGYNDTRGSLIGSLFERYTQAVNLSPKFFHDHLKVDVNFRAMENNNVNVNNVVGSAAAFDPTKPVWAYATPANDRNDLVQTPGGYSQGYWQLLNADGTINNNGSQNPVSDLRSNNNMHNYATRYTGNIQIDYSFHFLPDLHANLNLGFDNSYNKDYNGQIVGGYSAFKDNLYPGAGRYTNSNATRLNQLLDFYLFYSKDLKSIKSKIDATAGYSWQHFYRNDNSWTYSNPTIENGVVTDESVFVSGGIPSPREYYLLSLFGRLNYTLNDKYLLTMTYRSDQSSRFSPTNRVGSFPSGALAWRISQEDFLKEVHWLDLLKIRFGWGKTGQQDVSSDYYPYIPLYALSTPTSHSLYPFGVEGDNDYQMYSLLSPKAYNQNLQWETATTTNAGVDFSLFHGRLSGSFEYFNKQTKDLLNNITIPAGSNFTNKMDMNIGSINSNGVEATLNITPVKTKDFSWDVNMNATWIKPKITKLIATYNPDYQGLPTGGISAGMGNTIQVQSVGYAPNTFYAFQQVYDKNGAPIQNAFVDQNGDGIIDNNDLVRNHNPRPDVYFGLNMNFSYKQFDLGLNSHGDIGNYIYNDFNANHCTASTVLGVGGYLVNTTKYAYYVTKFTEPMNDQQARSDLFIENASFWKLDNIILGYSFKNIFNTKLKARVSFTVQNVLTATKYSGTDPEVSSGIAGTAWPRPRVFLLGLNINF